MNVLLCVTHRESGPLEFLIPLFTVKNGWEWGHIARLFESLDI